MALTIFEQGELEGQRKLLRRILEKRFGPLSQEAIARLQKMPAKRLLELGDKVTTARSLKGLGLVARIPADRENRSMLKVGLTTYEKGYIEGRRQALQLLLEEQVGTLPKEVIDRINMLSPKRVLKFGKAVFATAT